MPDRRIPSWEEMGFDAYYTGKKCPAKEGSLVWNLWEKGFRKAETELKNDPDIIEALTRHG